MWFEFLRPTLEFLCAVPTAILCYLPMKGHLRGKGRLIALCGIPALAAWALAGGLLCWGKHIATDFWMFPSLLLFAWFFVRSVELPVWKSLSVFIAVCGVFSSVANLAVFADALFAPNNSPKLFSFPGAFVFFLLCWLLLFILWYPAVHAARWLLSEIEMPGTWYVFWVVPTLFICLNRMFCPLDYSTLYTNRVMSFYPVLILAMLGIQLFLYLVFYLMARGLGKAMRLARENEFLQMQAANYRLLQKNVEDTRRARHDLRQHFAVLNGLVESGDLKALTEYVKSYGESLPPNAIQSYCKNAAVDTVLCYYGEQAVQKKIDLEISVRIGASLPLPEPEFCVLLGNLLENAIDGCSASQKEKIIRLHIRQEGGTALYLTVDNTCDKAPVFHKGQLRSTKHAGYGMGTESVRMIAERYNGDARFEWKDGMFLASVMLNS